MGDLVVQGIGAVFVEVEDTALATTGWRAGRAALGVPGSARQADADGTPIASGGLQFAIRTEAPAARVRRVGELSEIRHRWPTGVTRAD